MAKPVTTEQLDACFRTITPEGAIVYRVQSATDPTIQYSVSCITVGDGRRIAVCNCKAGQNGTRCWHIRASLEHARLYNEDMRCRVVSETELTPTMFAYYVRQNGNDYYVIHCRTGYGCECDQFNCLHEQAVREYRAKQTTLKLEAVA